jgi:hypothetical protein
LILSKSTLGQPRRLRQEQIQMITNANGMLMAMAPPIIDATAESKFPSERNSRADIAFAP